MDGPVDEIEVVGERVSAAELPAQITVIPVDDRLGPAADVASAVELAPGAVVRRLGGLGDWSSVSIRGSTARQVEVFLDGVPLNPEGAGITNLSELPLAAFDRVEVVRGGAPLALDTAAIGGAVNLVSAAGVDGARGTIAASSWGTARGSVWAAGPAPVGELLVAVDALATDGGYRWYDDGGTPSDRQDDREVGRDNNDTEQLAGLTRWRMARGDVSGSVGDSFVVREEGVPGPTFAPTGEVRYAVAQHVPTAEVRGELGGVVVAGRGWGLLRTEALRDPLGELGPAGERATVARTAGARVGVSGAPTAAVAWEAMGSVRRDGVDGALARRVGRWGAELTGRSGGVSGVAQLRGLAADDRHWWLPRVAGVASDGRWTVRGGGGVATRIPDLTELYGDRGLLVGNPELRPERSVGGDVAASVATGVGRVEIAGFAADTQDRVVWSRNAQGLSRPENVERARSLGLEAAADVAAGGVDVWLSTTVNAATNLSSDPAYRGRQLPYVPWFEAQLRVGYGRGGWRAAADLSATAGTFADATNFFAQPARIFPGALLQWHDRADRWGAALDVRNLTDHIVRDGPRDPLVDDGERVPRAIEDFAGQPLPGRTFTLSVRLQR